MKTIYLRDENYNWKAFEYNELSDLKSEFEARKISIGYGASIGYDASIGYGASIGNRASIGYGASIGNRASIGHGASIGNRASIGDDASIGHGASIGNRASIGDGEKLTNGIFINGSRHTVTYVGSGKISIGCKCRTIEEWKEKFQEIGERNDYTAEQIQEYGNYILTIEKWLELQTVKFEEK